MWLITNRNLDFKDRIVSITKYSNYIFVSDENERNANKIILFDGYISTRHHNLDRIKHLTPEELLFKEYSKHGENFINYIKGNFVIIQLQNDSFRIYSDRFAIKKYFYWQNGSDFIISDNIKEITRCIKVIPSKTNILVYALTYHFTGGTTLFENIEHNTPAQIIKYENNALNFSFYWKPEDLLKLTSKSFDIEEISNTLCDVVEGQSFNIPKNKISLSLTGGSDTRNLLAILLHNNITPHLYTYGEPASNDCVKASGIAKELDLLHSIHDIKIDEILFEQYARSIIKLSGGLASIHRVHRLIAVEGEKQFASWMFLGTLGGEFIRGVSEDDYIVSSLIYENWNNKNLSKEYIINLAESKFLTIDKEPLNKVYEFLRKEPYFNGLPVQRKLQTLCYITAHLHDAQDVNLFKSVMNEVYTPFLDIDYLELLFSSTYNFKEKESIHNGLLRRIENPVFAAKFLSRTYKPLLRFRYAGEHKPSEVLFNKYIAAILKTIRKKMSSGYPPNFPLGEWMYKFVKSNLPLCYDYDSIRNTFNLGKMLIDLETNVTIPKESFWLKFTNPIMMRFIIDEFGNGKH